MLQVSTIKPAFVRGNGKAPRVTKAAPKNAPPVIVADAPNPRLALMPADAPDDAGKCQLVRLAEQFHLVNCAYNDAEVRGDEIDRKRYSDDLDRILERASHLTPLSREGASFMIMLAHFCKDTIQYGTTEALKDRANAQQDRLLYRLSEFMGCSHFQPDVREFLMPPSFDPALEKRPAGALVSSPGAETPTGASECAN